MNKVEKIFVHRGLKRSGITMYTKKDSLEFIRVCENHMIGILGIDGFFITNETTEPSLKDSVDFSNNPTPENIYQTAIEFIQSRNDQLHFEIICE